MGLNMPAPMGGSATSGGTPAAPTPEMAATITPGTGATQAEAGSSMAMPANPLTQPATGGWRPWQQPAGADAQLWQSIPILGQLLPRIQGILSGQQQSPWTGQSGSSGGGNPDIQGIIRVLLGGGR